MTPSRDTLIGSRIRERRVLAGLRQADLARRVGISPSYLNLIEHNRRRIGGKLLLDLAGVLGVDASLLSEGAEAALIAALRDAAARQPGTRAELDRADEFAGRFPGWADLLAQARRRIDALERTVETLTDRLAHDPHLAASLHEVISTVTAIRATAAILADTAGLEPEWRDRFHRNINEDAARLAESSQALVTYLDTADDAGANLTSPQEEIEAFLAQNGYHFPALEGSGAAEPRALIEGQETLGSATARDLARRFLERYLRDARAMPLAEVGAVLEARGPDPAELAARCGTDLAAAMRRLALLPAAMTGAALGLVICDGSGTFTFRKPLPDFPVPRFGAACPLWPLFEALGRPAQPLARTIELGAREPRRFHALAVAQPAAPAGFDLPPLVEAHMLLLPGGGAAAEGPPPLPVGVSCRICPRGRCPARREPSILAQGF